MLLRSTPGQRRCSGRLYCAGGFGPCSSSTIASQLHYRPREAAQQMKVSGTPQEQLRPRDSATERMRAHGSPLEVLAVTLRLRLTSFGGPIAHLGHFHDTYVTRRKWVDAQTSPVRVPLCLFLPGPASSQVGIAIGITRAGLLGGLAAWIGFTLPSAVALVVFAYILAGTHVQQAGWLHGLMIAAVAVVAQAVWSMARSLAPDRPRATIALAAAIVALPWQTALSQVLVIVAAGLVGWQFLPQATPPSVSSGEHARIPISRRLAFAAWVILFGLLLGLPVLRHLTSNHAIAVVDSFFRVGALVFGGGHVVLPLLQREVVPPGWVTNAQFMAGYGMAQAVPGPLFTFSAYLGAAMGPAPNGVLGATLALMAIFLPSMLLAVGALPWWGVLRTRPGAQAALRGVNAAVVGILLAALYNPVWTSAILRPADFVLALCAFGALVIWRLPPWIVVLLTAAVGALLAATT